MSAIASNLQAVLLRIGSATRAAGRPEGAVRLIAVSKTFPALAVQEAIASGQRGFGENYVREAVEKMTLIDSSAGAGRPQGALEWHMIGPIQSNKTRAIAEHFDWVHSVDRLEIAKRLGQQRPPGRQPLNLCLQVNISGEASKSGVAPEQLSDLARAVSDLPGVRLRGLMAIPSPEPDPARQRVSFAALKRLSDALCDLGLKADELSMGMSSDLEAAILEGATMVRIGTAIFGARHAG
jgi:pyridoxal phosphate enzyme (YggS family)